MKYFVVSILILIFIIGLMYAVMIDKRNTHIIKLMIKRDALPPAAENSKWIQDGCCYMSDGSIGYVKGLYCEQISPV